MVVTELLPSPTMIQPPRRSVLIGTVTALAVGAQTADAQAAAPTRGTLLPEATAAGSVAAIGPRRVRSASELEHIPHDARLVPWRWGRHSGMTLDAAARTLGANDILVLPEDEKPFVVDSSQGFARDRRRWYAMCRVRRGIVGLGPGTVITTSASAFRQGKQTGRGGVQQKVIESTTPGAYFGNFTMLGRDFGGVAYNAIAATGNNTVWERIHFLGAHRGWLGVPPGESGAISGYKGSGMAVYGVEVDCRDHVTGQPVGSSPLMFNRNRKVRLVDVHAHHTRVGMPTFWECSDIEAVRLQHTDCGLKGGSPGVNLENCTGTMRFVQPTFHIDYAGDTHNYGLHLNVGGSRGTHGLVQVTGARLDSGPKGRGVLAIQHYGAQQRNMVRYAVSGTPSAGMTYRIYD